MIEYDYKIERIEDDKGTIVSYTPDKIPKKLYNLTYIEGPNSIGKSTLLDIIALAFFGLKNTAILEVLKDKMNNLINSDHQKLTFRVSLKNKDETLSLIAEKKSLKHKDIEVYELTKEGKKTFIGPEDFERKYKLIYDIPNNPTQRLSYLTNEIKYQQAFLGNKLTQLRIILNKVITDVEKTDPNKLEKAKKEYKNYLNQKQELEIQLPELERELDALENAVYIYYYQHYKKEVNKLKKELNSMNRSIKKKTKEVSDNKDEFELVRKSLRTKLFELSKCQNELSQLLKNLFKKKEVKLIFESWDELDLQDIVYERRFDSKIDYCMGEFESLLIDVEKGFEKDNTVHEIKMFTDLVNLLENYKDYSIKIPGLDQSIADFIQVLQDQITDKQKIKFKIENIEKSINLLNDFKKSKEELEKGLLNRLKDLNEEIAEKSKERDDEIDEFVYSKEVESKKKRLDDITKKLKDYEMKYNAKGTPTGKIIIPIGERILIDYAGLTEDQLIKSINSLRSNINKKNRNLISLNNRVIRMKENIEELKKVKLHKYFSYIEYLKELMKLVEQLNVKINQQYRENLNIILGKGTKKKGSEKEREKFNSAIFNYLGKVIGKIYHIDKEYNVKSINLLKKTIFTEEGTRIKFSDMGTGQSQSAYLKSLLSTSENKTIIALFDEIASMDSKSLEPIYAKMNALYKKGNLLAGIVVQRADDEVRIKNLLNSNG